jgi:hypothetical protein
MKRSKATSLLVDLTLNLQESRESIPWTSGAKAVKSYLDAKHGSKAAAVIGRMGDNLTDPVKAKIRDEVLGMYGSSKTTPEPKSSKTKSVAKKSRVPKDKEVVPEVIEPQGVSRKPIRPKKPKPNLANILNVKRPVHLTEENQKQIEATMEKVGPSISKRVDGFQEKHPILTKALKGAAIGGVVGLAMAATGGGAALAGALGGMAASTSSVAGAAVATKAAAVLSSSAATTAYATFYGARMGKSLAVHHYIQENKNKKGTFAYSHPYLTRLGML